MPDKQLTLRYRTLDQHVVYRGQTIEPYTPVDVPEEDEAIWEELVDLKVAEPVSEPVEEEPAPPKKEPEPEPSSKKAPAS